MPGTLTAKPRSGLGQMGTPPGRPAAGRRRADQESRERLV